jgi:hypothetical protein
MLTYVQKSLVNLLFIAGALVAIDLIVKESNRIEDAHKKLVKPSGSAAAGGSGGLDLTYKPAAVVGPVADSAA